MAASHRRGLRQAAPVSATRLLGSGKTLTLDATFDYLATRIDDENPRRLQARSLRASK